MAKKEKKDFEEQHPDENVVLLARNHPVVLRKPLYFMLLCITVPILLWSTFLIAIYAWAALVGFVVGSLVLFYFWISFNFSYYIITDQRVLQITQKGFFNRGVMISLENLRQRLSGNENLNVNYWFMTTKELYESFV